MNNLTFAREFNKLLEVLNRKESYFSGGKFISVVREIDPYFPDYTQFINSRKSDNKSTSRKDYFYDILLEMNESDRSILINRLYETAEEMKNSFQPTDEFYTQDEISFHQHKPSDKDKVELASKPVSSGHPNVFISYAWESDELKKWVKQLATDLRKNGVDAIIDQWAMVPGDQMTHFMEKSIRENTYVLIVCTPAYKKKSEDRTGGVGYEGDIMTAEVAAGSNHRKFIPILKYGTKHESLPSWLAGKYYIDLSTSSHFDHNFEDLLTTIFNAREVAPNLGLIPDRFRQSSISANSSIPGENDNVKIKGIVVDEVTQPINDGSRGSSLYKIPFELNKRPNSEWIHLFIDAFDRPSEFTSMHRPGIASVIGNKIYLDGTTIEEVERYHKKTLKLAVDVANSRYSEILKQKQQEAESLQLRKDQHRKYIDEASKRISFDD
ncbi:toll/interleukin-1 receptor domain-containing protein [Spirosoma panaciterrae]|uniref:toll/interleukin-1 receptor domain-containing protein n=1 Tax=Spirosoma panaciterrae TaxID=496058 RepID=UPI00036095E4|nr:toll/interleukin-1 receptor domain-containing protein [Spirosoma panaciterrae]